MYTNRDNASTSSANDDDWEIADADDNSTSDNLKPLNTTISQIRGFKMGVIMSCQTLDILAINETKLDDSIADAQIYLTGYDIVKKAEIGLGVVFVFIFATQSTSRYVVFSLMKL